MVRSKQIQGLRAVAVILVLLFHADWLPGGYIGVDVFYVISGYLITNLIVSDQNFSFANFYARRAKRLLPSAYLVLLVTALFFWLIAPSISRIQFAKDLVASTWYISNISFAFWQNDYQNLGAEPSVLIHYWSLAVEEQFYLIWPLLVIVFRRHLKLMVFSIFVGSFALSLFALESFPIWAFYSLPTRAFELAIGAFLALSVSANPMRIDKSAPSIVSWILIGLIVASSVFFDAETAFPGFPALVPTLGAAGLILLNSKNSILENWVFQKLGDWSYSIYLWHWPLLILPTMYLDRELTTFEKILVLAICILLGAITYKYYENPIRRKNLKPSKIFGYTLISALTLSAVAFSINKSGDQAAAAMNLNEIRKQPIIYDEGCQLDKRISKPKKDCIYGDIDSTKSVVLLGDSHAAQWFPAVDKWAVERGYRLIVMTKSSCPAANLSLRDVGGFKSKICNQFREAAIKQINILNPALLIVGSSENHKYVGKEDYLKLPQTNSEMLVLQDTPWPNRDIPTCLAKESESERCATTRPAQISYPNFMTFDPIPLLCDKASCPAVIDDVVVYRDHSHISVAMALKLYEDLANKLDMVVAR